MKLINSKQKDRQPTSASNPDGIRPKQAAAEFNVSIGTVYNLLPLVDTWTVTRPGSKRGMRFISRLSLDSLLSKMRREGV
jgi:hypothetical protein